MAAATATAATLLNRPSGAIPSTLPSLRYLRICSSCLGNNRFFSLDLGRSPRKFKVPLASANKQLPEWRTNEPESEDSPSSSDGGSLRLDLGWLPAFPHVLIASMSNFRFGYHIGRVSVGLSSSY